MRMNAAWSSPLPLVGRDLELGALRARLADALAGRGSLVLIGADAGVGKTALAQALGREAMAAGAQLAFGHCYDLAETPPYGPWLEGFAQLGAADPTGAPPAPAPVLAGWLVRTAQP